MKKTLAIATLALGLFAFGCDDDEDGGGKTDAGTNKDATVDTATPTPDVPKADTATDTSSADAADGGTGDDASADAEVSSDAAADWTACGSDPKAGVTAADFCLQYMKACTFSSGGGTAGMERYTSFSDCTMKYMALTTAGRGCAAYHLCVASVPANSAAHCPHPPEASLATPGGPCAGK